MKILMMLPAAKGVYPPEAEERRLNLMRSYSTPATQIDADYMPDVSGFVPWGGSESAPPPGAAERANALGAQRAQQAEREGYGAYCPYGTLDVGVREARRLGVKMPVVGQAEAALLFCGLLGRRFATVNYMPGGEDRLTAWSKDCGVGHLLAAMTAIGIPNSQYPDRREELKQEFVRCAQEAREKGAEIMGLVAMSICPTEYSAKELSEACGMPVLDAMACQIAMAEWWHRTGLPPSLLRIPRS